MFACIRSYTPALNRTILAATMGTAMVLGCGQSARAAYIYAVTEQGSDVLVSGSGSLDLSGLTLFSTFQGPVASMNPHSGILFAGFAPFSSPANAYRGFTGPASFGPHVGNIIASSTSGTMVGVDTIDNKIFISANYVSGSQTANSATFANQDFTSLGVTPGTYVWSWGNGANADSVTVQIGPVTTTDVPEPASAIMIGAGLLGLAAARRRKALRSNADL